MTERDHGDQLEAEIAKWGGRLATALATAEALDERGHQFMANIQAYQADTGHFYDNGDLVRAFEAVVWAWAWLEIGDDIGVLDVPMLEVE